MSASRAGEDLGPLLRASLPGEWLVDDVWLAGRLDQLALLWGCSQPRINATLWWYSTSHLLLVPAVRELVLTGAGVEIGPAAVRIVPRADGYLEQVIPGPSLKDGAAALGLHLDEVFAAIIEPLARAGHAGELSLWAIAVDSLATAVLAAAQVLPGGSASAPELAVSIADAAPRLRPLPRFVEIAVPNGDRTGSDRRATVRRYVRRTSCCLLLRVPGGKCVACPNQLPAEREERLRRHAQQS